jgi:hypothetical protein
MSKFVAIRNYQTDVEAEMYAQILRDAGIAVLLQGPQPGFFGAGFSGASVHGVTLLVAEDVVEEALELIGDEDELDA